METTTFNPSPEYFEALADFAERRNLEPYEGKKDSWIVLNNPSLKLGGIAYICYAGDDTRLRELVINGDVTLYRYLAQVPDNPNGSGWKVVAFQDVYFLKPYTPAKP